MLATKKYVDDIFLHIGDIPISHQHHNMAEVDVGDQYVMLETFNMVPISIKITNIGHHHHNTQAWLVTDI